MPPIFTGVEESIGKELNSKMYKMFEDLRKDLIKQIKDFTKRRNKQ